MDDETDPLEPKDPLDCRPDASIDVQNLPDRDVSYGRNILPESLGEACDTTAKWKIERIKKPQNKRITTDGDSVNCDRNLVHGCQRKKFKESVEKKKADEQDINVLSSKLKKKYANKEKTMHLKKQTLKKSRETSEYGEKHKQKVERKKPEKKENFDDSEKKETLILGKKRKNCRNSMAKPNRKFQCDACQKIFMTMGHLNGHMHCHSGVKWKCDGCGKNFSCERSLTRHRETFPGMHWFPCQHCDMHFFRVENVLKHLEIKHPEAFSKAKETGELILRANDKTCSEENIFICVKCLKLFHDFSDLKLHRENFHSCQDSEEANGSGKPNSKLDCDYIPEYKCEICSKEFVSLEGFEYHINNQHLEEAEKIKRSKDIIISEKEKKQNFACKICLQLFSLKSDYEVHVRSHGTSKSPSNHQCCICPRSFASSDGLKYHLATHTGERRYSCSQCNKKFIKKTHLYEHVATHSKVKCYKCPRCPRTFSTHSAYRKHVKLFPGLHSFPCSKCGKLFTKESMLEKHVCVDLVHVTMAPEVKALLGRENEKRESDDCNLVSDPRVGNGDPSLKQRSEGSFTTKSHSCYKCFSVFSSLDQLQTHQNEHIGKQLYQCKFCSETFKRADDFSSHIRSHLGSSPYMCLKCNRKFISPLTLAMHAKKYPGEHSFTCSKCQRWFPSEKRLEKHECILQNAETFVCACGSIFKNWNEFRDHAGSKPYKCCSCKSEYSTLVSLARHIKRHTGVRPFSCEKCGKSFQAKSNYLNHLKVHEVSREMKCEHCDFKSKSKKRLDFHLFRKHDIGSNTSSSLCPACGIIFPYVSQMKKHMEAEHANEVTFGESKEDKRTSPVVLCTSCGKLLSNKYMLANHMKKIHNPNASKSDPEFQCEVCEEKFRSEKRLQKHSSVHEAPSLRACEVCSREFFFAKDLKKHMKRHDTNKPFLCPKCGKSFKVSVSLKYHSSICGNETGNFGLQNPGDRSKQIDHGSGVLTCGDRSNTYYGYVEPLNEKNFLTYPVFTTCHKWNPIM